jgi:hypothetical protein
MDNKKDLKFTISEDDHARLRIKLQYECMSQTMFFNAYVKGYLEDNPLIKKYLDDYSLQNLDGKTHKKRLKDSKEANITLEEYGLNKEEIANIFDILQKENEDI